MGKSLTNPRERIDGASAVLVFAVCHRNHAIYSKIAICVNPQSEVRNQLVMGI
jgi:hypothetical protein